MSQRPRKPRIFADFHNADTQGRLRLNCIGTVEDLARQQSTLKDGQAITVYSEELEADAVVQYATDEGLWVAVIDWDAIRRVQDLVAQSDSKTT